MTDQHDIQEIYRSIMNNANDLMNDHDALAIAACMLAQALSIYRTSLTEEDYNRMMDSISEKQDKVQIFTTNESLH